MHYVCYALVRKPRGNDTIEDVLARAMAPYEGSDWDWYMIGGRWTGILSNGKYAPEKDPANQQECSLCSGTGIRTDGVGLQHGFPERELDPERAARLGRTKGWCNACAGEGRYPVWPTRWKPTEWEMQELRKMDLTKVQQELPRMLIDIDGTALHYEIYVPAADPMKGLGSFIRPPDYEEKCRAALTQGAEEDGLLIVVDCHT